VNILKKSLLSASVALALGGAGVAPETQAVQVAANGIGQVLLAPVYHARSGETTKLTIVNTSRTHAAKVKAVFRSQIHSTEVLDFLIYLTPGDVWRGEIYNEDGEAWVRSSDDSVHNLPYDGSWGSVETANVKLFDEIMEAIDPGDINEVGHIEFIGHYSAVGTVNTTSGPIDIYRTMSKDNLKRLLDMSVNDPFGGAGIIQLNSVSCPLDDGTGTMLYEGLSASTCPVRVDNPEGLRLRGNVEITNADGHRYGYEMTALSSSRVFNRNLAPIGATHANNIIRAAVDGSGYVLKADNLATDLEVASTHVIANGVSLEVNIATETSIGFDWGWTRNEVELSPYVAPLYFGAYDNILEIERALATTEISGAYENDGINATKVQVTFPTKYRHRNYDVCTATPLVGVNFYSAPFNPLGHVMYGPFSLDNSENAQGFEAPPGTAVSGAPGAAPSPDLFMFNEVNTLPDDVMEDANDLFSFESGQYQLNLVAQGGCGTWYAGVPTIAHTYKYTTDDSKNPYMIPASSDRWQWQ